jgi:hypothetical protein
MRVFLAWAVTAACVLVSCGGKVVLDTPSGTSTGTATGLAGNGGAGLGGGAGVGASFVNGGAGVGGGVGTGGGCPSCAEALVSGGPACNSSAYSTLQVCAGCSDTGNCEGVCGPNLCQDLAATGECMMCLQNGCAPELHACEQGD